MKMGQKVSLVLNETFSRILQTLCAGTYMFFQNCIIFVNFDKSSYARKGSKLRMMATIWDFYEVFAKLYVRIES